MELARDDGDGHAGTLLKALPPSLLVVLAAPPLLRQPLWYDEVATRDASRRSLGQLWHLLQHTDAVFGAYYLLIHLLLAVGDAGWWMRLPSLVAAALAVVYLGRMGRRLLGARLGTLAAGLFAVSPFVTRYAHDARPYAMALLGVTAAANQLFRSRPSRANYARWSLWASFAVVAHLFAVVSLAPQLWLLRKQRAAWPAILPPAVVAVAIAAVSMHQRGQVGWLSRPPWYSFLTGWATLSGGWWVVVLSTLGVVQAVRVRNPPWGVVVAWAMLPLAGLLAVSSVLPVYLPRYLIGVTPALALLSALGAGGILASAGAARPSIRVGLAVACAAIVSGVGCTALLESARSYQYENLPAAAERIRDAAQPGDGLVYLGDTARLGLGDAMTAEPVGRGSDDGPIPVDVLLNRASEPATAGTLQGASVAPAQATRVLDGHRRVWVAYWAGPGAVASSDPTSLAVLAALRHGWSAGPADSFGTMHVALWQRLPNRT